MTRSSRPDPLGALLLPPVDPRPTDNLDIRQVRLLFRYTLLCTGHAKLNYQ